MSAEIFGTGKVAVVTGGASGIGRALAGAFGALGTRSSNFAADERFLDC